MSARGTAYKKTFITVPSPPLKTLTPNVLLTLTKYPNKEADHGRIINDFNISELTVSGSRKGPRRD